jgi:hypothetical protein
VEQRQEKEHQYMQRHRRHQHKRSHAPESNRVAAPAC